MTAPYDVLSLFEPLPLPLISMESALMCVVENVAGMYPAVIFVVNYESNFLYLIEVMWMNAGDRKLIVILGTGRSGTSVAARMTRVYGYTVGEKLLDANEHNEKGYFEDADLFRLNMAVLVNLGLVEYSANKIASSWLDSRTIATYQEQATTWLDERLSKYSYFTMKDPRVTRLLPFWLRVFNELQLKPRYILAHRDPQTSAISLHKMLKSYSYNRLLRRLLCHTIEIESILSNELAIVDFDKLLTEPRVTASRVGKVLNLPIDDSELDQFVSFVSPQLNRSGRAGTPINDCFNRQLVGVSRQIHKTLTSGIDPNYFRHELEQSLTALRNRIYENESDQNAIFWVTLLGTLEESKFDEELFGLSNRNVIDVLVVHISSDPLTEQDKIRLQRYSQAGIRYEMLCATTPYDAAVRVMEYLEDIKGLYAMVRVPQANGLSAYVAQAKITSESWGKLKIDYKLGGQAALEEGGIVINHSHQLVALGLESTGSPALTTPKKERQTPKYPKVTVCILYQGDRHKLERTLNAVLGQTYGNIDIVIGIKNSLPVAQGSATEKLVSELADMPIRKVTIAGNAEGKLRNNVVNGAQGDYITFIASGTMPVVYAVEELVASVTNAKASLITSAAFEFPETQDPNEFNVSRVIYPINGSLAPSLFMSLGMRGLALGHISQLRALPYDETIRCEEVDFNWFCRWMANGGVPVIYPWALCWTCEPTIGPISQRKTFVENVEKCQLDGIFNDIVHTVKYAQGLHFRAMQLEVQTSKLIESNKTLQYSLDQRDTLFCREGLKERQGYVLGGRSGTEGCRTCIDILITVPRTDDADFGKVRRWLIDSLNSINAQWTYPRRVSIINENNIAFDGFPGFTDLEYYEAGRVVSYELADERVKYMNRVVERADDGYVLLMYAGDRLQEDALYVVRERMNASENIGFVYCDEIIYKKDRLENREKVNESVYFKSEFNYVKLLCQDYISRAVCFSISAVKASAGFRQGRFARATEYDMALRIVDAGYGVIHVEEPVVEQLACAVTRLGECEESRRVKFDASALCAVQSALRRGGSQGEVTLRADGGLYGISYPKVDEGIALVIWADSSIAAVEISLESGLRAREQRPVKVYVAYPGKLDGALRLFINSLAQEESLRNTVMVVGACSDFKQLCEQVDEELVLFVRAGAQLGDVRILDRMRGLSRDFEVTLFAPNLLTSISGEGVYHSTGCSVFLKNDLQEGRLFSGVSLQQPKIAEGFERYDLLDFYVTSPSLDAFGLDLSRLREVVDLEIPIDRTMPAKLAATYEHLTGHPAAVHVAANIFVLPTQEVFVEKTEACDVAVRLPDEVCELYRMAWGQNDLVSSRWWSQSGGFWFEKEPTWSLPRHKALGCPRVLGYAADATGCGEVRIRSPHRALVRNKIIEGAVAKVQTPLGIIANIQPNSMIFQRQTEEHQIERIARIGRTFPDVFKVYEIDDLLHQTSVYNPHRGDIGNDVLAKLRQGIGLCDRLVVSSPTLAEVYGRFSPEVVIVPNTIELARWKGLRNVPRMREVRPRVGWAGGISHRGDLMMMRDVIVRTRRYVDWIFFGYCPDELREYVTEFYGGVAIDRYPERLAAMELDLAIAPLMDTPFNRAKSALKVLEYGVLGVPVVASDLEPYNQYGFPIELVKHPTKAWVEIVMELTRDRTRLKKRGETLRQHVVENWCTENNLEMWKEAWCGL